MPDLNDVVILSAVRTAVGRFGGSLSKTPIEKLGAVCVQEAAKRAGVDVADIQSAVVGNVIRTKSKDAYVSRVIAIEAGMAIESHAVTVNRLCGSGLEAIVNASQQIQTGEVKLAVAGGAEVMSQSTFSSAAPRDGQRMGSLAFEDDLLATLSDPFGAGHMGMTAEKVGEQFEISREAQDAFAAESHRRAAHATENGYFKDQIVPVEVKSRRETVVFDTDEHFRADVTAEGLAGLPPAFKKDGGTVTAGNASGINDGASMLVLADAAYAAENGLKPMARIVGYARAGVEPSIMGTGPIPAVRKVLDSTGLSLDDMDVIESNEAFAAQACAVSKELDFPAAKTNPNGGAVALGHPVGATGAIISTKALYELERINGRYALITLCIGGGQGIAAVYERLS
ncbi:MAG: beta-ketothiolase BktB [Parvibaculales bacterium]